MKKFVIAAAMIALSSGSAYAASGNTSTTAGAAAAIVVSPITIAHDSGAVLNFGKFTAGTGGTVVVDVAGAGTTTSDVGFVPGSVEAADSFSVLGDPNRHFSIATTGGSVVSGSNSMNFTTVPSASGDTLDSTGNGSFTVGGTLTVAAAQAVGSYTGSYNATVTYN